MDLLEQTLEDVRSASIPQTKFTFKRKANKAPLSTAPTLVLHPSSRGASELENRYGTSDFHKLSSHSHCRLSLRSIPTFKEGPPLSDLTISDLDHCVVDLRPTARSVPSQDQLSLTALHICDIKETLLILPNVKGSVLLHNLHRCTVIVACHQVGFPMSVRGLPSLIYLVPHTQLDGRSRIPFCNLQSSYRELLCYRVCRVSIVRISAQSIHRRGSTAQREHCASYSRLIL
jgi:tubulin binding cofactor C